MAAKHAAAASDAGTLAATAAPSSQGVGELEVVSTDAAAALQQEPQRLVVVLYGSPMSGTSTQAAMLCDRYGIPCVTVDSLLQVGRCRLLACWYRACGREVKPATAVCTACQLLKYFGQCTSMLC